MRLLQNIYSTGIKPEDSDDLQRKKRLNNLVTFLTLLAVTFFIPYLWAVGNYYYIKYEVATVIGIASCYIINYFGWLTLAMFWRFSIVMCDVTYAALEMPGAGFEYFLVPLGLISFILSDNRSIQISLLVSTLLCFFLRLYISERHYTPHSSISHETANYTYIVVMTMTFALLASFIYSFKSAKEKAEKVVKAQVKKIEEQKQDIMDSITYAKRIQKAHF